MTKIPPWITQIRLPMPATLGTVNAFLIRGPEGYGLIDTGMKDASSRAELEKQLAELGLTLGDIGEVVFTHHHADHAGLGKTLGEKGAVTMMSQADAESLDLFFSKPEIDPLRANFYGRHEVPDEFSSRVTPMFPFFRGMSEWVRPDKFLEDGETIELAGRRFEVVFTPGHTGGHLSLRHELGIVFTGDCVTPSDATHISMRPEAIGTNPLKKFFCSLARLAEFQGDVALPGHGNPIDDLANKARKIKQHHQIRLKKVEEALTATPQAAYAVSEIAMGARPKVFARWLAMSQCLAYLEYLVNQGVAIEEITGSGIGYRLSADKPGK